MSLLHRLVRVAAIAISTIMVVAGVVVIAPAAQASLVTTGVILGSGNGYPFPGPGSNYKVNLNTWQPADATYAWYRCDSHVSAVETTSVAPSVPSDCTLVPAVTTNQYPIDSSWSNNVDEGKFITVLVSGTDGNYALAESPANFVVLNRGGGTNVNDGLRIVLANGSVQIIRNNTVQVYPYGYDTAGSSQVAVAAEGGLIVPNDPYSVDVNDEFAVPSSGAGQIAWDSITSALVTDGTNNQYEATTTFTKTFPNGHIYNLVETISYAAPNQVADVSFALTVPVGVASPVHLYYAMDMYLDGNDFGPGVTRILGRHRLVAQYNSTGVGGLLEGAGPGFSSYAEDFYDCMFGRRNLGGSPGAAYDCGPYGPALNSGGFSYPNTVNPDPVDAGVAAEWNVGTTAGVQIRNAKFFFGPSQSALISASYSQGSVRPNSQVLTYLNISNLIGISPDDIHVDVTLPDATYGTVSSTCGGTASIDTSGVHPHALLSGGAISQGSDSCQLVIPTTFTTTGEKTIDASSLVTGYYSVGGGDSNSLTNMLGESIDVQSNGPVAATPGITATSAAATSVTMQSATLNGSVTATGAPATSSFCYGTSATLAGCTTVTANPSTVSADSGATTIAASITGLSASTRYYYRARATNGLSSSNGAILSFTTSACYERLTGGNIGADETVLKFTSTSACSWTPPAGLTEVKVLVVAGGGGGGAACVGGGGGAGGVVYNEHFAVSGAVTATVGAGGSAGQFQTNCTGTSASSGGNSSFGSLTAHGGGSGGNYLTFPAGGNGGSGGGGGGVSGAGGTGLAGEGHDGGVGNSTDGNPGGGGGGASAAGGIPGGGVGGAGGAGFESSISGASVTYAAGGGGGSDVTGGPGGAVCAGTGASGETPATNATGYGCGGGGGDGHNPGGTGSSGVIIIRFTTPAPTTVSQTFRGFAFEKPILTTATKNAIRAWVVAHPGLTHISCTGYTGYNYFHRTTAFLNRLAKQRAINVCTYAKRVNPALHITSYRAVRETSQRSSTRRVVMTLRP